MLSPSATDHPSRPCQAGYRSEAGATIRELAAWSGAHRQTVARHLVQGRSRFARVWGDCRGGGPCQRSRPDRRLVEWKSGRPRCAAAQSARPPTAELDCDEVWNETCARVLSVFPITTGAPGMNSSRTSIKGRGTSRQLGAQTGSARLGRREPRNAAVLSRSHRRRFVRGRKSRWTGAPEGS